ncbi:MAG: O-acetylhomoserine aminocarboxypropyltransferase/cysteine synthase family protein [Succinivibrio sp.]|uniref:O-acetylhomoserine aminocarboxypropyltransferase/cysteine synthase family protein n=1 Tax=Succinivibrio sp. TaxID=2053619 RepID=UPI000B2164BA|nr:O-acetylhomoserine aminocarboxypropyltransferase/cysteine synthase [Succinivibrio sp.]MDY5064471.1 O-acetylhomoserine aminocarboxypropyltransferase/cysteine synthase family protein [Succinivibrio sp.]PWM80394.1 MAG: O-acetylhomoserine aminocarboxypropyltransferase [Succinivibrio sp.]
MKDSSKCLHAGYTPKNAGPRVMPIVQSTTFRFDSTKAIADLFDLKTADYFYTRLGNPTCGHVEEKIAALEGGVGAMLTSSGQAATLTAVLTIAKAGDHILCSSTVYGGTFNLMAVTFKRMGIDVTFFEQSESDEEIEAKIQENTKAVFGETIANPALTIFDIERFAKLAHKHHLPLIVDNTFATPCLCKPFEFGADIVVHSTTKYLDGHAVQVGGCVVDSGNFDWAGSGRFPEFTTPDDSYHGLVYTKAFGKAAFIVKARVQIMRDLGCCQTAQGAFYLNLGIETLPLRIVKHSQNALAVAKHLESHPKIEKVIYPGLESNPDYKLGQKYLKDGLCSGVLSLVIKGGREAGAKFIDSVVMSSPEVHVADIRTCLLHPATSTHRQLSDAQLIECGITPGLVRLSVGLEDLEDIIADLDAALAKV